MQYSTQTVAELIATRPDAGAVLFEYGIRFHQFADQPFSEVLERQGLDSALVEARMELSRQSMLMDKDYLGRLPLELLLSYLTHQHQVYIRQRLPYFTDLISAPQSLEGGYEALISDLRLVFPMFREDFIKHVYDEEDSLFAYIRDMLRFLENPRKSYGLLPELKKTSLQGMALSHMEEDDDMAGIRAIAQGYSLSEHAPLTIRVLFAELQFFEKELRAHAEVENTLLFPKALQAEYKVKQHLQRLISSN